jgi:hypothetical protein
MSARAWQSRRWGAGLRWGPWRDASFNGWLVPMRQLVSPAEDARRRRVERLARRLARR